MKSNLWSTVLPVGLALLVAAAAALWLARDPAKSFSQRVPVKENMQVAAGANAGPALGHLIPGPPRPTAVPDFPGSWPQFRGPLRDGIAHDQVKLAESWPASGPAVLWTTALGEGYAGPAVLHGRVYLLDYDRPNQSDALRCLSLADGQELWRYSYPVPVNRNHGMSRTVPAVTEKYIVSLGPKCHVSCLATDSGKLLWSIDLVRGYGAQVPDWYAGQCPLIDGDLAILAPGGPSALLIAVDCATGQVKWTTPNPRGWKMSHSSIMPMTLGGRKMYVYCGQGGVAGVDAEDGRILWDTREWKVSIATVASPVAVGDDRVFFAGGYNSGALMLQVTPGLAPGLAPAPGLTPAPEFTATPLFRLEATTFGATQHTPIFYQDHIYGIRPSGELVCLDFEGKVRWTSGTDRFGKSYGPVLISGGAPGLDGGASSGGGGGGGGGGGLIYAMTDDGLLRLVRAAPDGYKLLASAQVIGHDSWGPMALVGTRLLVRDLTSLRCLEVGAK